MPTINTRRAIVEAVLLAGGITLGLLALTEYFTDTPFNIYETLSVFFTFSCVWLCTRQVRFNYIFGTLGSIALIITFAQANLWGSMAINIYLIPTVIYGWFVWGRDSNPRPVERVKLKWVPVYLGVTALAWYGANLTLSHFDGGQPKLDSWLLAGTILAQFLMDRKKLENWIVWIAVNVVSIYVYFQAGLYLLVGQFSFFIINALIALVLWHKAMKVAKSEPLATGLLSEGKLATV